MTAARCPKCSSGKICHITSETCGYGVVWDAESKNWTSTNPQIIAVDKFICDYCGDIDLDPPQCEDCERDWQAEWPEDVEIGEPLVRVCPKCKEQEQ